MWTQLYEVDETSDWTEFAKDGAWKQRREQDQFRFAWRITCIFPFYFRLFVTMKLLTGQGGPCATSLHPQSPSPLLCPVWTFSSSHMNFQVWTFSDVESHTSFTYIRGMPHAVSNCCKFSNMVCMNHPSLQIRRLNLSFGLDEVTYFAIDPLTSRWLLRNFISEFFFATFWINFEEYFLEE